jgi:hypothetical protein
VKSPLAACLLAFTVFFSAGPLLHAQTVFDDENWDIDSMFDEPEDGETGNEEEIAGGKEAEDKEGRSSSPANVLNDFLQRKGFTFDASFSLYGGLNPGWTEAPWHWEDDYNPGGETEFTPNAGVGMTGTLSLDFQLSDILRIKNGFSFSYPAFAFIVSEFFMDYNFVNHAYFRAGKTVINWGQSRNYSFTNLPARLPLDNPGGDSYLVRTDIPIGIGGLQFLVLTRSGFMQDAASPGIKEMGYGTKYNAATRWVDVDVGLFFHRAMPLRSFLSLKTTVLDTELYTDLMYAVQYDPEMPMDFWERNRGAFGIGAARDFFGEKISLNLEYFYNQDKENIYYRERDEFSEAEVSSYIIGSNAAVNLVLRPIDFKNLRIFAQCLYSFEEKSAWLTPGISIEPIKHISVYLGSRMALGGKEGAYYLSNADNLNRPFSFAFLITVSGDYGLGHYE